MRSRTAHFFQQFQYTHALRHKAWLADKSFDVFWPLGPIGEHREQVLDVDHAGYVIQRFAIDRHPAMAMFHKGSDGFIK